MILQCNVLGVHKRINEIRNLAAKHNPHIIILNEVKVKPSGIYKYNIQGYLKISDNKKNHEVRGRGVRGTFMYIRNDLSWSRLKSYDSLECCSILLNTNNGQKITINGIYAAPGEHNVNNDIENILNTQSSITVRDWNAQNQIFGHNTNDRRGTMVYRYINNGLVDIALDPRESRPTAPYNKILDFAITTIANNIMTCENVKDIGSDHVPILAKTKITPAIRKKGRTRLLE